MNLNLFAENTFRTTPLLLTIRAAFVMARHTHKSSRLENSLRQFRPMLDLLYEEGTTSIPGASAPPATEDGGRTLLPAVCTAAVLAAKLAVTAACFWYFSSRLAWSAFAEAVRLIHMPWAMLALAWMTFQIPLVGIRGVGVMSLLQLNGFPAEQALALSISFGVVTFPASLPGAIAWLLYSLSRTARAIETC